MKKFNVGDIVKANVDHPKFSCYYNVTNEYALCKVIGHLYDKIEVEVIYHAIESYFVGRKYPVISDCFDLVIPAKKTSVKEMTVREISDALGFEVKIIKEDF